MLIVSLVFSRLLFLISSTYIYFLKCSFRYLRYLLCHFKRYLKFSRLHSNLVNYNLNQRLLLCWQSHNLFHPHLSLLDVVLYIWFNLRYGFYSPPLYSIRVLKWWYNLLRRLYRLSPPVLIQSHHKDNFRYEFYLLKPNLKFF